LLEDVFGTSIDKQPLLRELDPTTSQRIVEGFLLKKIVSETQVASRKLQFYAGNALDEEIKNFFDSEAKIINMAAKQFQRYYEKITKESNH